MLGCFAQSQPPEAPVADKRQGKHETDRATSQVRSIAEGNPPGREAFRPVTMRGNCRGSHCVGQKQADVDAPQREASQPALRARSRMRAPPDAVPHPIG